MFLFSLSLTDSPALKLKTLSPHRDWNLNKAFLIYTKLCPGRGRASVPSSVLNLLFNSAFFQIPEIPDVLCIYT